MIHRIINTALFYTCVVLQQITGLRFISKVPDSLIPVDSKTFNSLMAKR